MCKLDGCVSGGHSSSGWQTITEYAVAIQASVLELWKADRGSPAVREQARSMAAALAAANGAAAEGRYEGPHPSILAGGGSLREAFRGWSAEQPGQAKSVAAMA